MMNDKKDEAMDRVDFFSEINEEAVRIALEQGYRERLFKDVDNGEAIFTESYDDIIKSAKGFAFDIRHGEGLEDSSPEELAYRLIEKHGVGTTTSDVDILDG